MPALPTPRSWAFQLGAVTVMPRKDDVYAQATPEDAVDRRKLTAAINLARRMVLKTTIALKRFDIHLRQQAAGGPAHPLPPQTEAVYVTLAKYFSLDPTAPDYRAHVRGVTNVFALVNAGLGAPYDIVVFDPSTLHTGPVLGYVMGRGGRRTADVSPVRRTLGFTDEVDHRPWTGSELGGRIHLSLELVKHGSTYDDLEVGRILVHEATHKFARTTDVLYKHESFKRQLATSDHGLLPTMTVAGVNRVIRPMIGLNPIAAERWLQNADSYAWAAHRIHRKG